MCIFWLKRGLRVNLYWYAAFFLEIAWQYKCGTMALKASGFKEILFWTFWEIFLIQIKIYLQTSIVPKYDAFYPINELGVKTISLSLGLPLLLVNWAKKYLLLTKTNGPHCKVTLPLQWPSLGRVDLGGRIFEWFPDWQIFTFITRIPGSLMCS